MAIPNPIGYWKLDEASGNALDAVGTNDLTDTNTVGTTTGKVGTARDFVAANGELFSHGDNATLSTGDVDFTITAWFKPQDMTANRIVVGKGGGDIEYDIALRSGGPNLQFRACSGSGFAGLDAASDTTTLSAGTWYFVVGWHDATANTLNIQVNNGTVYSTSYSGGVYDGPNTFYIGKGFDSSFDGAIDEVGFWKQVLTTQERTDLWNGGAGLAYSSFGGAAFRPAWAAVANRPVVGSGIY